MTNQQGGKASGDRSSDLQSAGRPEQNNLFALGGGEVVIPIGDELKKKEKKELSSNMDGNQPLLDSQNPSRIPPALKTKRIGHKLLVSCRMRPMSLGSKAGAVSGGRQGCFGTWWRRCYDFATLSPGSELFAVFLAFLGLSLLAFFVCLVVTKIIMEGCGWSMCIAYYHNHHNAFDPKLSVHTSTQKQGECVFRRYIPHLHFPFIEIIHDFRSRHSVLVEGRHGHTRCVLFDMSRYVSAYDSCPASYPNSLDERMGVPAASSKLSQTFPRRFAKHFFAEVKTDFSDLKRVVGTAIAERCMVAKLHVALLVEARLESNRCRPARQLLVDQILSMSDSAYLPLRSEAMSDDFSDIIVLFENWNKNLKFLSDTKIESSGVSRRIDGKGMELLLRDLVAGSVIQSSVPKIFITTKEEENLVETPGDGSRSGAESPVQSHQRKEEIPKGKIRIFEDFLFRVGDNINSKTPKEHETGTIRVHRKDEVKSGERTKVNEEKQGFHNGQHQGELEMGESRAGSIYPIEPEVNMETLINKNEAIKSALDEILEAAKDLKVAEDSVETNRSEATLPLQRVSQGNYHGEPAQVKKLHDERKKSDSTAFAEATSNDQRAVVENPHLRKGKIGKTTDIATSLGKITALKDIPSDQKTGSENGVTESKQKTGKEDNAKKSKQLKNEAPHTRGSDQIPGTLMGSHAGIFADRPQHKNLDSIVTDHSEQTGGTNIAVGFEQATQDGPRADNPEQQTNVKADGFDNVLPTSVSTVANEVDLRTGTIGKDNPPAQAQDGEHVAQNLSRRDTRAEGTTAHATAPGLHKAHSIETDKPEGVSTLLSLIGPALNIAEPHGMTKQGVRLNTASLFKEMPVETEARRYYMWRGRIVRVCLITKMP